MATRRSRPVVVPSSRSPIRAKDARGEPVSKISCPFSSTSLEKIISLPKSQLKLAEAASKQGFNAIKFYHAPNEVKRDPVEKKRPLTRKSAPVQEKEADVDCVGSDHCYSSPEKIPSVPTPKGNGCKGDEKTNDRYGTRAVLDDFMKSLESSQPSPSTPPRIDLAKSLGLESSSPRNSEIETPVQFRVQKRVSGSIERYFTARSSKLISEPTKTTPESLKPYSVSRESGTNPGGILRARSNPASSQTDRTIPTMSHAPALSPFLHFRPNGRVPPLLDPRADPQEDSLADESLLSLDSIMREPAHIPSTNKSAHTESIDASKGVSWQDLMAMVNQKKMSTIPSLQSCMDVGYVTPKFFDLPHNSRKRKRESRVNSDGGEDTGSWISLSKLQVVDPSEASQLLASDQNTAWIAAVLPSDETSSSNIQMDSSSVSNLHQLSSFESPGLQEVRGHQVVYVTAQDQQAQNYATVLESHASRDRDLVESQPKKPRRSRKRDLKLANDSSQTFLDFGQKEFGCKRCKVCGFVYGAAHPGEEDLHLKHHQSVVMSAGAVGVNYNMSGNENVVFTGSEGCVIIVNPQLSPPALIRAAKKLQDIVDRDLGIEPSSGAGAFAPNLMTLVYARKGKLIGLLQGEAIQFGYRVIPSCDDLSQSVAWCCRTEPEPAALGISKIWVSPAAQRTGVATQLLNTLRCHFQVGDVVDVGLIAFSDPTDSGRLLAANYCKRSDFLVYKYLPHDLQSRDPHRPVVRDFLKEQEEQDAALLDI